MSEPTDLELCRATAEALDVRIEEEYDPNTNGRRFSTLSAEGSWTDIWNPLDDDAQNALVEWWLIGQGSLRFNDGYIYFTTHGTRKEVLMFCSTLPEKRRAICVIAEKVLNARKEQK